MQRSLLTIWTGLSCLKVLEDMNFGKNSVKWMTLIYTSQTQQIIIDGDLTKLWDKKEITVSFYILVLGILNRDIRHDKRIMGIKIKKSHIN